MTRRSLAVTAALAVALGLSAGCTHRRGTFTDPQVPAGGLQLVAFDDCAQALASLRSAARAVVGPWGFGARRAFAGDGRATAAEAAPGGAAAAPSNAGGDKAAGPTYSGTNTHEAGVDEPDLVKTDGRRIVTVSGGVLRVVDAARRVEMGRIGLGNDPNDPIGTDAAHLLLAGDRVLVLGSGRHGGVKEAPGQGEPTGPQLLLVDIAGAPRVVSRYTVDGSLVDARQVGSTVRVVLRSAPRLDLPQPRGGGSDAQRIADNVEAIDRAPIEAWLPRYTVDEGGQTERGRVSCDAVSRPARYSAGTLLTVLSFDLGRGQLGNGDPVSIVADGETVYANGSALYVASDERWRVAPEPAAAEGPTPQPRTEIYKFETTGTDKPRFVAAGAVEGWLLNQYSMSEWNGHLRVATTQGLPWSRSPATSQSTVYVLRQQGRQLTEAGRIGGLGKGERIYAVRFLGGIGYVVTFRQTDPLYTVDLRNPARPIVTGELKIAGYSAYLHPAGDARLIGIGQEATEQGRVLGTQLSLFDVGDPANPRRLAVHHVRYGHSEAEFDPHAFLYWPPTGLLVVPLQVYGGADAGRLAGALALRVTDTGITEAGTVQHPSGDDRYVNQIRRSLVIDQTLWTVSGRGLLASDLRSTAEQAWLPFS